MRYSGGVELQAGSIRNRPEDQPVLREGEASGTSAGNGTTRRLGTPDIEVTEPQQARLAQQDANAPPEVRKTARRKWSRDENLDIVRAYFMSTQCERRKSGFRKRMVAEWKKLRPESRLSEGQVANQLYAIRTRKLLTELDMEEIKNEVRQQIDNQVMMEPPNGVSPTKPEPDPSGDSDPEDQDTVQPNQDVSEKDVLEKFAENLALFDGTDPTSRPKLKKINPNRQTRNAIDIINRHIKRYIEPHDEVTKTQTVVYCAATAVIQITENRKGQRKKENNTISKDPPWKQRLDYSIRQERSRLTQLNEYLRGNPGRSLKKKVKAYLKTKGILLQQPDTELKITVLKDALRQRIEVLGKRLGRYNKSYKRKQHNQMFQRSQKLFYRQLEQKNTNTNGIPDEKEFRKFWENIWEYKGKHNETATWLEMEKRSCERLPNMDETPVTSDELRAIISQTQNWKAPGSDHIHNFWWKKLEIKEILADQLNSILEKEEELPRFLTKGLTYMLPKTEETKDPKNYRPITCLPTLYKINTSVFARKVTDHIENIEALTEEQKGCRPKNQGCQEQLNIDTVVTQHAKHQQRNIAVAWIDYQKAFDSVPHSWLIEVLNIYKIDKRIVKLLKACMSQWRTTLSVNIDNCQFEILDVPIKSGIFQGDSLSPVWFVLSLNPLSRMLKSSLIGFQLKHQDEKYIFNHLAFVDDFKLYGESETDLGKLIAITKKFSDDIKMEFGLSKCAKLIARKGKRVDFDRLEDENGFRYLQETYKYLGFEQHLSIDKKNAKEQITKNLKNRVEKILKTELNGGNKIKAINTWAIPAVTYSFGAIKWSETEIEALNRTTRVQMTKHRIHHPKGCTERLYLPREHGGRGLTNLKNLHNTRIKSLRAYFYRKAQRTPLHRLIAQLDKKYSALNLKKRDEELEIGEPEDLIAEWKGKTLHGRFPNALAETDKAASVSWLRQGDLYGETEGFMVAVQDGVIATRNYQKYIQKIQIDSDSCRMCGSASETIEHITSSCTVLAPTEYLRRHNLTAGIIHQELALKLNLLTEKTPYYKYVPFPVLEDARYRLYWDTTIQTDKTIQNNRPDIVLLDRANQDAIFIDVAHPGDHNVRRTEREKVRKYLDLQQEYRAIHNLRNICTIPIVMSVNGLVSRDYIQNLKKIGVNENIHKTIQKSVVLETCRIIRKTLNIPD